MIFDLRQYYDPSGIRVNELQQIPNMQKAPGTVFHTSFTAILRYRFVEVLELVKKNRHETNKDTFNHQLQIVHQETRNHEGSTSPLSWSSVGHERIL